MQITGLKQEYNVCTYGFYATIELRVSEEELLAVAELAEVGKEVSLVEKQPVENLAQKLRKSQYEKFCTKALKLIEAQVESFSSTFAVYDKLLQQYVDVFFTSRGFRVSQVRDHEAKVSW
jgi:hypothetical protein